MRRLTQTQATLFAALTLLASAPALAQKLDTRTSAPAAAPAGPGEADRVNVEAIKEKYWARGDESEIGVVQNRLYSKAGRFQFGLFGATIVNDPFLSNRAVGGTFGYNFSEYVGVQLVAYKNFSSDSDASTFFSDRFQAAGGGTLFPPTNKPRAYYGAEGNFSLIYGKLSLIGRAIVYYDLHLTAGLGLMNTENGNYVTPSVGLGQQFYLNQHLSLRLDYRLFAYREELRNKVPGNPQNGTKFGDRTNFTNSISIGVQYLFGSSGGKKK